MYLAGNVVEANTLTETVEYASIALMVSFKVLTLMVRMLQNLTHAKLA